MSSVYDVPCMYVHVFDIRDGMLASSYVCTYGVLLGIRLTEGCQLVGNKRAREQHPMCDLSKLFQGLRTDKKSVPIVYRLSLWHCAHGTGFCKLFLGMRSLRCDVYELDRFE